MNTFSLFKSDIKRFVRDWKSVLLLTVFPLSVVALIFISFSPTSAEVPVGGIYEAENFQQSAFEQRTEGFANLVDYSSTQECLADLERYEVYACVVVENKSSAQQYSVTTYYDNTREVIDRTILGGIRRAVSGLRSDYSERQASRAISEVEGQAQRIESARREVNDTRDDIGQQVSEISSSIADLKDTRDQLRTRLQRLDEDVDDMEKTTDDLESARNNLYTNITPRINRIRRGLEVAENAPIPGGSRRVSRAKQDLEDINNDIEQYNNRAKDDISDMRDAISEYRSFRENSQTYFNQIDNTIERLRSARDELKTYDSRLESLERDLASTQRRYERLASQSPKEIAQGVSLSSAKAFKPKGIESSLLVLQSIYSTLLLLVGLFVSVLISMFVSLKDVQSPAGPRLSAIPKTALPRFLSSLMTSSTLTAVPLLCVLAIGEFLLMLPISENLAQVAIVLILFTLTLSSFSMSISYIIKKKSSTLLVGSFVIVFFIFFSGFVLPTEMMKSGPRFVATSLPGSVSMAAFDQAVLYGQPLREAIKYYIPLASWCAASVMTALFSRRDIRQRLGVLLRQHSLV